MGFNTTVVVLNDALHEIENDPNFGKNLADVVRRVGLRPDGAYLDVPAGNHCNAATVVETHHADSMNCVLVGGNMGDDLGRVMGYDYDLATIEGKRALLKALADRLGVNIRIGTLKR